MVTIVMSNLGLEQAMDNAGIKMVRTAVGDRYILERMLAEDYNFGGEQSGHIIFLDHNTTGDRLISAHPGMGLRRSPGKSIFALLGQHTSRPQAVMNVRLHRTA